MLTHMPSPRKLVIIGDGACGKTSLLSVFTLGYFPPVRIPVVSFWYGEVEVANTDNLLQHYVSARLSNTAFASRRSSDDETY